MRRMAHQGDQHFDVIEPNEEPPKQYQGADIESLARQQEEHMPKWIRFIDRFMARYGDDVLVWVTTILIIATLATFAVGFYKIGKGVLWN